jgi:transcriptional regulator with XRE-family HTH domain
MDRPGEKLKRAREHLGLTYRDVEHASQKIAHRRGSDEFAIALSRLADIENKGTTPTIYRIYTLCAIYQLDYSEVLQWYGVAPGDLPSESVQIRTPRTQLLQEIPEAARATVPLPLDIEVDLENTTFLSQLIRRWGKSSLSFLNAGALRTYRYGLIGCQDWSMCPLLHPGAIVAIDQNSRKIATSGWSSELDRPIYFFEHRGGYSCGWANLIDDRVLVQPHPSSGVKPTLYSFPSEIDVVGQVCGVAMMFESPFLARS